MNLIIKISIIVDWCGVAQTSNEIREKLRSREKLRTREYPANQNIANISLKQVGKF